MRVKELDSHAVKALSSAELCSLRSSGISRIKFVGLLKNLGLVIGPAKMNAFASRAAELIENRPELAVAVTPLLTPEWPSRSRLRISTVGHEARTQQCSSATVHDCTWHRSCHRSLLSCNDRCPTRFKKVKKRRSLCRTNDPTLRIRRDRLDGRISKLRRQNVARLSFEEANVLHTRSKMVSAQSLGHSACKTKRLRKAKVAVARKACGHLHRMWIEGTEFRWSKEPHMPTA